jgi:hypothetical protein
MIWLLRSVTTARDNETPSLLRIAALMAVVQFVLWGAVAMWRGEAFDPRGYGEGFGLLALGIGSALRISLPANAGNDGWQAAGKAGAALEEPAQ